MGEPGLDFDWIYLCRIFTLSFRSFSPLPGVLEFLPGQVLQLFRWKILDVMFTISGLLLHFNVAARQPGEQGGWVLCHLQHETCNQGELDISTPFPHNHHYNVM